MSFKKLTSIRLFMETRTLSFHLHLEEFAPTSFSFPGSYQLGRKKRSDETRISSSSEQNRRSFFVHFTRKGCSGLCCSKGMDSTDSNCWEQKGSRSH